MCSIKPIRLKANIKSGLGEERIWNKRKKQYPEFSKPLDPKPSDMYIYRDWKEKWEAFKTGGGIMNNFYYLLLFVLFFVSAY